MKTLEMLFWIFLAIVFYTYIGYGILLFVMVKISRWFKKAPLNTIEWENLPQITLLIAAFNEKDYVAKKVANSLQLHYPKEKLTQMWVTDGSNDGTPELLKQFPFVKVLHQPARMGKIAAMNRAMKLVNTEIVVFSDANTLLGQESIQIIAQLFANPKTGCVSGEKRIALSGKMAASSAGEGIYWKYESTLKKWDAELNTAVGAAGELFAIRTQLYQEVEADTLLDDFIISLRIAMQGYKIEYNPQAYAMETASANVKEELKRKIRIAAGGIQSVVRLSPLLNIFKYRLLAFQYLSHRVFRWTLAPLSLIGLLIVNPLLIFESYIYLIMFVLQILFYLFALTGWWMEHFKIKVKVLFVPYYFFIMNYAVVMGFVRYLRKNQSVNWERAKRMS
jgi:cellulose synthase/poly-beta-1,6-N-acetylglucosamine synthase-like glycosyltransferase